MRRVAEFSSVDAAEIEPEAAAGGQVPATDTRVRRARGWRDRAGPRRDRGAGTAPQLPFGRPAPPADRSGRASRNPTSPLTPQALAAARLAAARNDKFDRTRYETVRSLDRLHAWIERARENGFVAIDTQTHESRSDAGRAVRLLARGRAERSLLRAARPSPRRGGRQRHAIPRRRRARSDSRRRRARGAQAAAHRRGRAQDRRRISSSTGRSSRSAASRSLLTTTPS